MRIAVWGELLASRHLLRQLVLAIRGPKKLIVRYSQVHCTGRGSESRQANGISYTVTGNSANEPAENEPTTTVIVSTVTQISEDSSSVDNTSTDIVETIVGSRPEGVLAALTNTQDLVERVRVVKDGGEGHDEDEETMPYLSADYVPSGAGNANSVPSFNLPVAESMDLQKVLNQYWEAGYSLGRYHALQEAV